MPPLLLRLLIFLVLAAALLWWAWSGGAARREHNRAVPANPATTTAVMTNAPISTAQAGEHSGAVCQLEHFPVLRMIRHQRV